MDSNHKLFITVKDHSVSKRDFRLYQTDDGLLVTNPQPQGQELAAYYESDDYISHTDGKRSLFERIYQSVKKIALQNKLRLITKLHSSKGVLLDIGAGTGDFLKVAKDNEWEIIGVEPNTKARSFANQKGIILQNDTATLESHCADVITMWHVLEHVPDLQLQLSELKRLLKPEGTIVIAVPNYKSFDAEYYQNYWAAYDVPRHLWHFSKTAMRTIFERENFQLVQTLPMLFDAYYVSLLSEKYKTGKMNFIKAFLIGLKSNLKGRRTGEYSSLIYIFKNQ
ncbi:class I SAM-dependent methyltransferase [Flavobacterium sp. CYK-4]|uniref:class I SAM-dependent methyltransferase n=1 Tax=Flavobacterium lotistagni TaxID=2709660 RepID=UPI00140A5B13|nr:class I SAM-dependent methyltransferase [Flavobacterium lotistagni]NHM06116.1 class I SAM-dependent methyltransferase [Flavobacterium lotistagni]